MKHLNEFMENWLGYGTLASPVFVIGPEPGGRSEELESRVRAWKDLSKLTGRSNLIDAPEFHKRIGEKRWFGVDPAIQPTWRRIIITYLIMRDIRITNKIIGNCQRDLFGNTSTSGIAKMYLMPLSSPRMNDWHYSKIGNRREYEERVLPSRIAKFQKILSGTRNKNILMLGFSMEDQYRRIVDAIDWQYQEFANKKVKTILDNNGNNYVMCYHPMAGQSTDQYFMEIGRYFNSCNLKR